MYPQGKRFPPPTPPNLMLGPSAEGPGTWGGVCGGASRMDLFPYWIQDIGYPFVYIYIYICIYI